MEMLGTAVAHAHDTDHHHVDRPAGISFAPRSLVIDWANLPENRIGFVYLEASQGTSTVHEGYAENQRIAQEAGIRFGGYHQYFPGQDPMAQATLFADTVGVADLPPALRLNIAPPPGVDATYLDNVTVFLDTVEARLGCRPLIYAAPQFYVEVLGKTFPQHKIWLAADQPAQDLPNSELIQFWRTGLNGSLPGMPGAVDTSRFMGDAEALSKLACP